MNLPHTRYLMVAAILGATIASGTAAAAETDVRTVHAEDGVDYRNPDDSPVSFVALGQYGVGRFQGRFVMSGTWHYGYQTDDPEDDTDFGVAALYFVPDRPMADSLPYWLQNGHVRTLRFTNETVAAKVLVPLPTRRALAAGRIRSASGHAAVRVTGYRISIECDTPTYWTTFVAVDRSALLASSHGYVERPWC